MGNQNKVDQFVVITIKRAYILLFCRFLVPHDSLLGFPPYDKTRRKSWTHAHASDRYKDGVLEPTLVLEDGLGLVRMGNRRWNRGALQMGRHEAFFS